MTQNQPDLKLDFFFLSPVEVVKVTSHNLDQVAEWCGGKVAETASRRVEGRMDKYVWVPTPKGTGISWAFPGMFITKRLVRTLKDEIKTTFAVFRRDYFEKNYFASPELAISSTWERGQKKGLGKAPKPAPPNEVTVNVMGDEVMSLDAAREVLAKAAPDANITVNHIKEKETDVSEPKFFEVPPAEEPPTTHEQAISNLEAAGVTGEVIEDRPSTPDEQRTLLREAAVEAEANIPDEKLRPAVNETQEEADARRATYPKPGEGQITKQGSASIREDVLTDDILVILGLPTSESDSYGVVTWGSLTASQLETLENATKGRRGGIVVDGLHVPEHGLYGIRNMMWGQKSV